MHTHYETNFVGDSITQGVGAGCQEHIYLNLLSKMWDWQKQEITESLRNQRDQVCYPEGNKKWTQGFLCGCKFFFGKI